MLIRKATQKDINAVYAIMLELLKAEDSAAKKASGALYAERVRKPNFEQHAKRELKREIAQRNALFLVAAQGESILGYARGTAELRTDAFFQSVRVGVVESLCVQKIHRGKGIARQLMESLEAWFVTKKCVSVHLSVLSHNPALGLYHNLGYQEYGVQLLKKLPRT